MHILLIAMHRMVWSIKLVQLLSLNNCVKMMVKQIVGTDTFVIGQIASVRYDLALNCGTMDCNRISRATRHASEKMIIEIYPHSAGRLILKKIQAVGNAIMLRLPTIIWYFLMRPVANIVM